MALKKEIKKENGLICNYHRISNINLDIENKYILIKIKSYINKEMRDKEKRYIEISNMIIEKENKIILQEITYEDTEYLNLLAEKETLPSNTMIEEKEYRLEKDVTVDTIISIKDVYNLLKLNHGIFRKSVDI